MSSDVEHLFMYSFAIHPSRRKWSIQVLCSFKNQSIWLFSLSMNCMSSLQILDINSLPDMWFANIFSQSIDSFFILLIASFVCRGFFIWCSLTCLCLLLLLVLLMSHPKYQCQRLLPRSFFLMLLFYEIYSVRSYV